MKKEVMQVYIVAGVVLERYNKYLLVQEKQPAAYGLWNLPAGKVEVGDSLEDTAIKEAKEETGFDIRIVRHLAVFHFDTEKPVQHAYKAEIIGGSLEYPKDELLNAKWFSLEEIEAMHDQLRGEWVLASIKESVNQK